MSAFRTSLTRTLRTSISSHLLTPCSSCIISSSKLLSTINASTTTTTTNQLRSFSSSRHSSSSTVQIRRASTATTTSSTTSEGTTSQPVGEAPPLVVAKRPTIKPRKAAISLTPEAVTRIRSLLSSPSPKLIRIGVRNKGCAGMSYHLEYVDAPSKFDEIVQQDGVKVVVDSRALFSVIGSEMDWQEDALQAKFVFKNPNIKDACGCGE